MASKRTWDDVLRDRGFDPEKRKKQQAAKYADESYKSRQKTTISQIEQSEAVRKKQALQSIAESDAIKALDRLKTLTLGGFDETKLEKPPMVKPEAWREILNRNTPSLIEVLPRFEEANAYAEKLHKEQEKLYSDKKEKTSWYKGFVPMLTEGATESIKQKRTGWDLIKGVLDGLKQKKDMTKEKAPVVKNQLAFTKEDIARALGSGIFGDKALDQYERVKKPGLKIPGDSLGFADYVDYIYNKLENLPNNGEPMNITLEEALSSPAFTDAKRHFDQGMGYAIYRTSRNIDDALKSWWETTKGTAQTLAGMALESAGRGYQEIILIEPGSISSAMPVTEAARLWQTAEGRKIMQKGMESFQKAGEIRERAIAGEDFLTKVQFDIAQNIPDLLISAIIALGTGGTGVAAKEGAKQAAKSVATTAGKKALLKEVAKKAGKALLIAPDTLPLTLKSFASSYQENLAKGWDENKALSNALLKAYGEGLLEKGGLQSFIKSPDKGVVAWLASGAFEGSEELTQDMWSNIIDNPFGEDEPLLTGDSLYSGLIGALTGWLIGAPAMTDTSPDIKVNDNKISVKDREGKTHTAGLTNLTVEQLEILSEHPVIRIMPK